MSTPKLTGTIILLTVLVSLSSTLRPFLFIHGLNSSYTNFGLFESYLEADFPGIKVMSLDAYNLDDSIQPIEIQIPVFSEMVRNITENYGNVTLVGHSQGAFIARAILQTSGNPHIHTLISVAASGIGNYGTPDNYLSSFTWESENLQLVRIVISKICYGIEISPETQEFVRDILKKVGSWRYLSDRLIEGKEVSLCGYWRDPTPEFYPRYLRVSKLLPYLNNELPHIKAREYKANFLKVRRLILAGGPGDGVIKPWQTSQYGYFDENLEPVEMRHYFLYFNGSFGLKTLDERNAVTLCTVQGVAHDEFIREKEVYEKCVKPFIE